MEKLKKGSGYWALYFALPLLILLIWELTDAAGMIKPYTMPSPEGIVKVVQEYVQNGKLAESLAVSMIRVLEGFFLALVAAFSLGMGVSLFPKLEVFTDLIIQILRPIPPIAWIPLAILWFGIGEESKIFIIFLGSFFPIFVNIADGVKSLNKKFFELAKVYEISWQDKIRHIIVPGALPSIMTGIRLGLGNAWVCVVAAEMIGATKGVGYMLSDGRSLSRPDIVILGMLIVGVVGKIMDDILLKIRNTCIRWI